MKVILGLSVGALLSTAAVAGNYHNHGSRHHHKPKPKPKPEPIVELINLADVMPIGQAGLVFDCASHSVNISKITRKGRHGHSYSYLEMSVAQRDDVDTVNCAESAAIQQQVPGNAEAKYRLVADPADQCGGVTYRSYKYVRFNAHHGFGHKNSRSHNKHRGRWVQDNKWIVKANKGLQCGSEQLGDHNFELYYNDGKKSASLRGSGVINLPIPGPIPAPQTPTLEVEGWGQLNFQARHMLWSSPELDANCAVVRELQLFERASDSQQVARLFYTRYTDPTAFCTLEIPDPQEQIALLDSPGSSGCFLGMTGNAIDDDGGSITLRHPIARDGCEEPKADIVVIEQFVEDGEEKTWYKATPVEPAPIDPGGVEPAPIEILPL